MIYAILSTFGMDNTVCAFTSAMLIGDFSSGHLYIFIHVNIRILTNTYAHTLPQCAIDQYFFLLVRTKGREQKVVRVEASVLKHDTRCFVNRWSLLFALFLEHLSSSSGMNGSFNRE